jgi:hypothetical protein
MSNPSTVKNWTCDLCQSEKLTEASLVRARPSHKLPDSHVAEHRLPALPAAPARPQDQGPPPTCRQPHRRTACCEQEIGAVVQHRDVLPARGLVRHPSSITRRPLPTTRRPLPISRRPPATCHLSPVTRHCRWSPVARTDHNAARSQLSPLPPNTTPSHVARYLSPTNTNTNRGAA